MDDAWLTYILTPSQKKTSTTRLTKARGWNNVFPFPSCCQYNSILKVAAIFLSLKWHRQAYINAAHCALIKYSGTNLSESLWPCVAWRVWELPGSKEINILHLAAQEPLVNGATLHRSVLHWHRKRTDLIAPLASYWERSNQHGNWMGLLVCKED